MNASITELEINFVILTMKTNCKLTSYLWRGLVEGEMKDFSVAFNNE